MGASDETGRTASWVWWVTAALVVAVLGGASTVIALNAREHNPAAVKAVLEDYVGAVADGDADRANELSVVDQRGGAQVVVDAEAFAEATHITDVSINSFHVSYERGTAEGDISYRLDGIRYSDSVQLRQGESKHGDDAQWYVTSGLRYNLPYDFAVNGSIALAGMDEPFPAEKQITAFAGTYEVISTSRLFETTDATHLRVSPDTYDFEGAEWLTPSPEYSDLVNDELKDWYADCAEQTNVDSLRECGIDVGEPDLGLVDDVRVEVQMVRPPKVELDAIDPGWSTLGERGEFDVTMTGRDESGKRVTRESTARASAADIVIIAEGDSIEVLVESY